MICNCRYGLRKRVKDSGSRLYSKLKEAIIQVRRGGDRAEIYSLAFSSTWLAVSSDKGTVHVFSLKVDSGSLGIERSRSAPESSLSHPPAFSSLSFIKAWSISDYFWHPVLVIVIVDVQK
ncbi:hypothetical protein RHMOL_Rhmol13G0216700 [Rhododendron molle]|uniref:Uncharacterized protein n=1 Tax=Rhododendron molle TaxID=49168 RepID=A0ACC0L9F4_RHOML|nr:hypothetical protein RHMOL_Rhmol13G0216700 [Rhododendron molle]